METVGLRLNSGKYAIIDCEYFSILKQYSWVHTKYHITRWYRGKHVQLKRDVAELAGNDIEGLEVLNLNRNLLDCRRDNLMAISRKDMPKYSGMYKNNKSGYRGVSWDKYMGFWLATISVNKKRMFLGYFTDKRIAAICYNEAAREHYGESAILNKV